MGLLFHKSFNLRFCFFVKQYQVAAFNCKINKTSNSYCTAPKIKRRKVDKAFRVSDKGKVLNDINLFYFPIKVCVIPCYFKIARFLEVPFVPLTKT